MATNENKKNLKFYDILTLKQKIADKAQNPNEELNIGINLFYNRLYNDLVKSDFDRDVFQDTYLYLCSNYDPKISFDIQFRQTFKNLRKCFIRTDNYFKQHFAEESSIDSAEVAMIHDEEEELIENQELKDYIQNKIKNRKK